MKDDSIDYDDGDNLMDPLPEELPYFFSAICGIAIVIVGLLLLYGAVQLIWNLFR